MASKTKDSSDKYEFTLNIDIPPEVLPQTTAQAENTELSLIDTDTNMDDNSLIPIKIDQMMTFQWQNLKMIVPIMTMMMMNCLMKSMKLT